MKTTRTPSALNLDFAHEAPPPELPAVVAPPKPDAEPEAPLPPARVQTPLTTEGLTEMLANRRSRNDGWTPIRVAAFIERLAETASVTKAAACADMSVAAAYHLRNHPDAAAFREAWDSAMAVRFETLTEIAMDRVTNGVERTKWVGEMVIGHDRVFSDRLLIYMMNRSDPDRDRSAPLPGDPVPCRLAGPRAGVLPLAADFVVAAGTETGRLGWDPGDDYELEPDIAADVAVIDAAEAARKAAQAALSAGQTIANRARAVALDADRAAIEAMKREDAEWDKRYAALARGSKFSSFDPEPKAPRRRRR